MTAVVPVTSADLAVSGQAPAVVESGAIAVYALSVVNSGPADAAHVAADNDPDPSNNEVSLTTFIAGAPFALVVDPATLNLVQGLAATFTIRLLNDGVAPLLNVDVQAVLPPGMTLIAASPSSGSCSLTPTIACHADIINSADLFSVRLVAMPPPPGSYTSHISAASGALSAATDLHVTVVATSRRHAVGH